MKQCTQCGVIHPLSNYSANGHGGLKAHCKPCVAAYSQMASRAARYGMGDVPYQPSAVAHRLWQACDVAMGGERRLAA